MIDHGEDIEKVMESIYIKGRDNARTPMQWNDRITLDLQKVNLGLL